MECHNGLISKFTKCLPTSGRISKHHHDDVNTCCDACRQVAPLSDLDIYRPKPVYYSLCNNCLELVFSHGHDFDALLPSVRRHSADMQALASRNMFIMALASLIKITLSPCDCCCNDKNLLYDSSRVLYLAEHCSETMKWLITATVPDIARVIFAIYCDLLI